MLRDEAAPPGADRGRVMADRYSEVSQQGFFSRLKGAIGGVVIGLGLLVGAFPLQFWNEGRAVTQTKTLEQGESAVRSVPNTVVDAANEGQLVHVSGNVTASQNVVDEEFGIDLPALALRRKVEMYQWKEETEKKERKKLGGGTETETIYSYERTWDDDEIDSSDFRHPEGHANPGAFPVKDRTIAAPEGKLGAYTLGNDVLEAIDEWKSYDVPADTTVAIADFRRAGDGFYRGNDPGSPDIGDVRVRFETVPEGEYTFIAQQQGNGLAPWVAPAGNSLLLIGVGSKPAPEMFATAHRQNTMITWALRGAGFMMMWIGLGLMLRPFTVLADVVPMIGSIVGIGIGFFSGVLAFAFSLGTIAIAWIVYRPVLGVGLLVVAGAAFFLLRRRRGNVAPPVAPAGPTAMPPPPPPPRR
jgi:hypothetical protein